MFFGLFARKRNAQIIEALYQQVSDASRRPIIYSGFGMPDTLEGRFDSLTLHTILVLRRLRQLPSPASEVAQDLVDILFREIERSLREVGIGDVSVPKKMKLFAKTFYGRASIFDKSLEAHTNEKICKALMRPEGASEKDHTQFAIYIRHIDKALSKYDLEYILSGKALFPDAPSEILE